jgi:hypothetical protein
MMQFGVMSAEMCKNGKVCSYPATHNVDCKRISFMVEKNETQFHESLGLNQTLPSLMNAK